MNVAADSMPGGAEGTRRVVIRDIQPQVDAGEYAVKRIVGDAVKVSATVFADSHDAVCCSILYRHQDEAAWSHATLTHDGNDVWKGEFSVAHLGLYTFTVQGWVDHFVSWHRDIQKRASAGQDLNLPLLAGAALVEDAVSRADADDSDALTRYAQELRALAKIQGLTDYACPASLVTFMGRYPDLRAASTYERALRITVDRVRARYSTWYELFPRSTADVDGSHGTLKDCENRIPIIAGLGFDVLYLPPIHPIGKAFRKGRNNSPQAEPQDVGSPWAIGSELGGHKAIHPQLGSMADFLSLVGAASNHGMEIALDIAFQCAPDHPYVRDHPEWFLKRPDGTIQYAENPPKKYQDIYPLNFETAAWRELWNELKSVFTYWIKLGVRIFRVDNPHTKSFLFWKWVIENIKKDYPDVLFLAEAFTRPHPMYELAKLGFSQSYTYFTWRNTKEELTTYLTELTTQPVSEFFRPNFWPNTPDILPYGLQRASYEDFAVRFILASTLSASYGIYGSAFELLDNLPKEEGSEEYLNSEKYELKHWNDDPGAGLRPLIRRLNIIRSDNIALQSNESLRFHLTNNASVIAYSKVSQDKSNVVLVVVNLDPRSSASVLVTLDRSAIGLKEDSTISLRELLSGAETRAAGSQYEVTFAQDVSVGKLYEISGQSLL